MLVTALKSLFEHKHDENSERIKRRPQHDIHPGGARPDPCSQRDMFQHQHNFGQDQRANQRHRPVTKCDAIFGEDQVLEQQQRGKPRGEIESGQGQGLDLVFEFLL